MESGSRPKHGCFFKDGKRRADYVIVIRKGSLGRLTVYINALQILGLELEIRVGQTVEKLFLLLHISQEMLKHYSKIYDVGLEDVKISHPHREMRRHSMMYRTPISHILASKEGTFTSADRIAILDNLLKTAKYGDGLSEIGISKLIELKLVEIAYPLHDGPETNGEYDILYANDRQLLYYYWANFRVCLKELPLDMINRYFGSEVAFYFAWLEYFNLMLVPAAILGTLVFIVNIILLLFPSYGIKEICEAHNTWTCPTCEFYKKCSYLPLASYCTYAKWDYVFDNYSTVAFAVFMSFWANIFIHLWRRRQNELRLRWGIRFHEKDITVRKQYLDMVSRFQGNKKLVKLVSIMRMTFSVSVCIFMILLVLAAVFGVILFKIFFTIEMKTGDIIYLKKNSKMIALVTGCVLQVIFISIFGKMYGKLSIWLTNFANPRTQHDYDTSVLHMRYLLAFVNNYMPLFYIAFLKGRLFSLPHRIKSFTAFERDTCQPSTCITALCLQLGFLMLLKKMAGNVLTLLCPLCKNCLKRLFVDKTDLIGKVEQYEKEYMLLPTNRYLLTSEFSEMVIEYGFVTFFVAAFPLAPLFALLNNIMETRLDAYKLVVRYRRPVPRVMPGIGSWDGVILGVTHLSTATNAFVLAFTSDFIGREIYRYENNYSLKGYVNSTLSEFATKDYDLFKGIPPDPDTCYYRTMRYPPSAPNKYELTEEYWVDFMWRLICVIIFEHVILGINGILSMAIRDIPLTVKQQLDLQRHMTKNAKLRQLNNEWKQGKNKGEVVNRTEQDPFRQAYDDRYRGPLVTGPIGGFMTYK